jgi:hypothetical protein
VCRASENTQELVPKVTFWKRAVNQLCHYSDLRSIPSDEQLFLNPVTKEQLTIRELRVLARVHLVR